MRIKRWSDAFGNAKSAHALGVTGRLAEVSDGTTVYLESTAERSAAAMLRRFASTARYYGRVKLAGRIVAADGTEADRAKLVVEYGD